MSESNRLRQNVAVLFSPSSRAEYARQAQSCGETYSFSGARGGQRTWLKGEYAYLAPNAATAVLNRIGIKHDIVVESEEAIAALDCYSILFIPNAAYLQQTTLAALRVWQEDSQHFLVVSGKTNLPPEMLGLVQADWIAPPGYTGWRFTAASPFSDPARWEELYVTGYKGYTVNQTRAASPGAASLAELYELTGDLTSSQTATRRLIGDGIVATANTLYFANQYFEYIGGVLQAHLNVEDVRLWFNPTHWGDTLAYLLAELLGRRAPADPWAVQLKPFGTYEGVLQLQHDADHRPDDVIDLTFLRYEIENTIPATHYILDPSAAPNSSSLMGAKTWVRETAQFDFIEAGVHNDSAQGDPPCNMLGQGLYQHIRSSERSLGITARTAARHKGFLLYPESIDAMEYLFDRDEDLLGLSVFSLYDVIEYGKRDPRVIVEGKSVTYATFDPSNPGRPAAISGFWFPYHAVSSCVDGQVILRGWDSTHDTDCDYARIDEILEGANARGGTGRLENGVYVLQYEQQYAVHPEANEGRGQLPWVRYAISKAQACNYWLANRRMLFERMNDYQDVVFRVERGRHLGAGDRITLFNPTKRVIRGLMVRTAHPLAVVTDDEWAYIHIVADRTFTVPPLGPGERLALSLHEGPAKTPRVVRPNSNTFELVDARCHLASRRIEISARAAGRNWLTVSFLPPNRPLQVSIQDSRGKITLSDWPATAQGVFQVELFGREAGFSDIKLVIA